MGPGHNLLLAGTAFLQLLSEATAVSESPGFVGQSLLVSSTRSSAPLHAGLLSAIEEKENRKVAAVPWWEGQSQKQAKVLSVFLEVALHY